MMCDTRENLEPYQRQPNFNPDYKYEAYDDPRNGNEAMNWNDDLPVFDDKMNQLNKEDSRHRQCPDILRNISDFSGGDDEKCKEKLIPMDVKEMNNGEPWKSKDLGVLVPDDQDKKELKKRRRERKLKKGLGWAFWVTCAPVAFCFNCIREQPEDPDDPRDWNDDPLRPWRYRVDLPK